MKTSLVLANVLLFAVGGFADTSINNWAGYVDAYGPFPAKYATIGELFTAPTNGDTNLTSFSFYMGSSFIQGDIVTGAYIATWTGSHAGTLLYSSPEYDYNNYGNEEITFNTGDVALQSGAEYVMFLSVSQYDHADGQADMSQGKTDPHLKGAAYYNNGSNFNELFTNDWDRYGLSPDLAVDLEFNLGVPEPSSLMLLSAGVLGCLCGRRGKQF